MYKIVVQFMRFVEQNTAKFGSLCFRSNPYCAVTRAESNLRCRGNG